MDLLKEYSVCLASIKEMQKQLESYEEDLRNNERNLREIDELLESLRERDEEPEIATEREISRRLQKLQMEKMAFLEETDRNFANVNTEYDELCLNTKEEARVKMFGKGALKKLEKKVESIAKLMSSFKIDIVEAPEFRTETMSTLSKRVKKFNKLYDEYIQMSKYSLEDSVDIITLNGVMSKCKNPQVSVALQSLYVGLLATIFLGAPFLVLLGYLGINIKELNSFLRTKKAEEGLIRAFLEVKASLDCIHRSMESELNLRCDELLESKKRDHDLKIKKMEEDRDFFLSKYDKEEQSIEALRDDESFKEEFKSKIPEEIKLQESEKDNFLVKAEEIQHQIKQSQEKIDKAKEDLNSYRAEIENKYLSLTLGEDRLLTPELFLGFNEDTKELITFNHNCDSVLVYYLSPKDSDTPDSVNDFILMIMVQLLCTLESPSVDFRIFNDYSGNRPYAAFTREKLSGIVTVLSDNSEMQKEFKALRAEIVTRTSTIGKRADDIQSFNKLMIESKSLPLSYVFVICHSVATNYYTNTDLLYTLREGPRVGVIPMIFVSLEKLKSSLNTGNTEECKKFYNLLLSLKTRPFQFDSVSGRLIACPELLDRNLKFELEKATKGRGRR